MKLAKMLLVATMITVGGVKTFCTVFGPGAFNCDMMLVWIMFVAWGWVLGEHWFPGDSFKDTPKPTE